METITAYKQRINSYVDGDPIAMQRATPDKLKQLLTAVPAEKLDLSPAPCKWSIREIVAHLADDELVGAYRIRLILSASGTDIQAFDQAQWAIDGNYASIDVTQSLSLFTVLRQWNLTLFDTLTAAQWKQYGLHAERGKETIEDIVTYYAGHDINHLKQIEAICRMWH